MINYFLDNFDKEFESEEFLVNEQEDEIRSKAKKHKKHQEERPELNIREKKQRRRRDEDDESQYFEDVTRLQGKLREAIELDIQSFENEKPSLEKLKILPKIEKLLGNKNFQKLFLQSSGLELLQEWIKKGPDGTYPALNQITQMLDIISNLNLNLSYLKSCQIGGHVMELSKNVKIPKPIQKKAKDIVEKWSRIVWDINTNYSDIDTENRNYERIYQRCKINRPDSDDEEGAKENNERDFNKSENIARKDFDIYSHAKIPKKALFDFTIKPTPNVSDGKVDELAKSRYNFFDKRKTGGRKKNE